MCDGGYSQLTGCLCIPRPPLASCVQEAPALSPLCSDEVNEVREACEDIISAVGRLKDSIGLVSDDAGKGLVPLQYLYMLSAIADLTKAVIVYMEPEDGGEPY